MTNREQEDELSIFAARDLDEPMQCVVCGEIRTVIALVPGTDRGEPQCCLCWERRER